MDIITFERAKKIVDDIEDTTSKLRLISDKKRRIIDDGAIRDYKITLGFQEVIHIKEEEEQLKLLKKQSDNL